MDVVKAVLMNQRAEQGNAPWAALQRVRPVNPEQSHCGMASTLEAAQRSFASACDRPNVAPRAEAKRSFADVGPGCITVERPHV